MTDLSDLSAVEQCDLVADGEVSALDLVEAALRRIETIQPRLNPFAFVFAGRARAEARKSPQGPLSGLPVAFKDFTPTKGDVTTLGSRAYERAVAQFDPVIVQRFRAAGAIVVGKTTTPEFAYAGHTASPLWGVTRNPWDPEQTAGGSSGGSAVAVTTGAVALAEGTDMGGSVRIPAACCGCVGLKPSLGRIPMDILPSVFDGMSHFGPLARTVEDAALFLKVAEGADLADPLSQRVPKPLPRRLTGDVKGLRLALTPDLGFYHVEAEVDRNLRAAADALADRGAAVEEIDLDWCSRLPTAWAEWWDVTIASAFGHLLPEWRERLDPAVVAMMDRASCMGAIDFKRIEAVRTEAWRLLVPVFERYDALLCPTITAPAPRHEEAAEAAAVLDEAGRFRDLDMTAVFNCVAPCPAMSVPAGMTDEGHPTALQIVGRPYDDPTVLEIGRAVELARPWPGWSEERLAAEPVA